MHQDELRKAFATGDAAAVAAYFSTDVGRKRVAEAERHHAPAPTARARGAFPRLQPGFNPWYISSQGPFAVEVNLLSLAIERGHGDVIDWLYDEPNAADMPATLAFLFPEVCAAAVRANDLPTVDMLLSSQTFLKEVADNKKQALLNSLLQSDEVFTRAAMLELLIAHGANISSPETLAQCAATADMDQLELLLRDGACAVGHEVLSAPASKGRADTVSRLIECGADANAASGIALYRAALRHDYDVVRVLLEEGFADASAESLYAQTALSAATTRGRPIRPGVRWSETMPLHQVQPLKSSLTRVRSILLKHGADPSDDQSRCRWWSG